MGSPIIMPPIADKHEPRCPKCDTEEDIKRVCSNCGWEYKDPELEDVPLSRIIWGIVYGLASAALIIWVFHFFGWDQ